MLYETLNATKITEEEKEKIVEEFLPKIKSWVIRMKQSLPESVDIDELYSSASMGLIEAIERFDKSRNASFYTYAERRIKGAMLDSLRSLDVLPRNIRTQLKMIEAKIQEFSSQNGKTPTIAELAQCTELSEVEVRRLISLQDYSKVVSLNDSFKNDDESTLVDILKSNAISPEDELVKSNIATHISNELKKLSQKEQVIIRLYYYDELTMKEISEVLGVTESRVSQIHSTILKRLRSKLADIYG